MKKCVIVVPFYRETLTESEQLSLNTLLKVNEQMGLDILYVCPHRLAKEGDIGFDDSYFTSLNTYSELLLSYKFWKTFENYEYILIYQLDCLIFHPNILDWCNRGWDYIGAPWSEGYREDGDKLWAVGNGGFSLRRVSKVLDVFRVLGCVEKIGFQGHEDTFWSQIAPQHFPFLSYKVASLDEAKYFSWETNISLMKRECKGKIPTGCHAYEKREPKFFKELLK
jgi:hypothetical protein